jgi:hypothetical protein
LCLAATPVILEELADSENTQVNADVTDLSLSLHIHLLWNNSVIENWEHYRKAMQQLRKTYPNLKTIHPNGGHSYYRQNAVSLYGD